MKIYAIYDRAAELYGTPYYQTNDAVAIRNTKNGINHGEGDVHMTPSDYELWRLADFNDETGEITMEKERIARCEELAERK